MTSQPDSLHEEGIRMEQDGCEDLQGHIVEAKPDSIEEVMIVVSDQAAFEQITVADIDKPSSPATLNVDDFGLGDVEFNVQHDFEDCNNKDSLEPERLDLQDVKETPNGTSCLICYARCEVTVPKKNVPKNRRVSYQPATSIETEFPIIEHLIDEEASNELDAEMGVMFVVKKLMQLPKTVCEELLKIYGNPSEWGAAYCSFCTNTVEEAQEIAEKIANYRMKFKCLQERVKDEILISAQELVPTGDNVTPPVIEDIRRRFIQSKDYINSSCFLLFSFSL